MAFFVLACVSATAQAERLSSGTRVVNQAHFSANGSRIISSNEVVFETSLAPTSATLALFRFARDQPGAEAVDASNTECSDSAGEFSAAPYPSGFDPFGSDHASPSLEEVDLLPADTFTAGEPIFTQVEDDDRNLNTQQRDFIEVIFDVTLDNGVTDRESIRLQETGNNTGVFAGFLQTRRAPPASVAHFDCFMAVQSENRVQVTYVDDSAAGEQLSANVLIDPDRKSVV